MKLTEIQEAIRKLQYYKEEWSKIKPNDHTIDLAIKALKLKEQYPTRTTTLASDMYCVDAVRIVEGIECMVQLESSYLNTDEGLYSNLSAP